MKQALAVPVALLLIFFTLLFIYTRLAGPIPFSVTSVTTQKSDTFNVSGEGIATVNPDIAVVTVGIQAEGSTVKQAQDQINSVISRVSEAVKKLGVEGKDIKTTNYNINPQYDFRSSTQRITGYSANTNLQIKVRDINKVNQVIDEATTNGANQVSGVTFDVDDKTKAEAEAREQAVAETKKKAQDAAKIAGFSLGRIINYSENFQGGPIPLPMGLGAAEKGSPALDTKVEPGSSEIKVVVTLSYEVR